MNQSVIVRYTKYFLMLLLGTMLLASCSNAHSDTIALTIDDRQAITTLINNYSYNFDSKNLDAFLDMYTQDAIWEDFNAGSSTPVHVFDTPEKMRQAFGSQIQKFTDDGTQSRHFLTNITINMTGLNSAEGTVMFLVTHQKQSLPQDTAVIAHTGHYKHKYSRTSVGWKFQKIDAYLDHSN